MRGKGSDRGRKAGVHLIRYADDFIITGKTKELLDEEVKPLVESFLRERGLELSAEKTKITHIEEGFDFLGQNVRRYKPWQAVGQTFQEEHLHVLGKGTNPCEEIAECSGGEAGDRTQPHDSRLGAVPSPRQEHAHLQQRRPSHLHRTLALGLEAASTKGQMVAHAEVLRTPRWPLVVLLRLQAEAGWKQDGRVAVSCDLLTVLHLHQAKRASNPYHPAWEMYFEERESEHMAGTLAGRAVLLHLWRPQGGKCPACGLPISRETGWHSHHVVPKVLGGHDGATNRQLLHPECPSSTAQPSRQSPPLRLARGVWKA